MGHSNEQSNQKLDMNMTMSKSLEDELKKIDLSKKLCEEEEPLEMSANKTFAGHLSTTEV
jgi:hypothetical protein